MFWFYFTNLFSVQKRTIVNKKAYVPPTCPKTLIVFKEDLKQLMFSNMNFIYFNEMNHFIFYYFSLDFQY